MSDVSIENHVSLKDELVLFCLQPLCNKYTIITIYSYYKRIQESRY